MSAYEPGRLYAVTSWRGADQPAFRTRRGDHESWCVLDGLDTRGLEDREVTDIRPLVVIDPEDREQCQAIHDAQYRAVNIIREQQGGGGVDLIDALQMGLGLLLDPKPPKPAEPLGLGAVVEDAAGRVFVRQCTRSDDKDMGHPWLLLSAGREPMPAAKVEECWRELDAVRVLSEGVLP